MKKIVKNVNIIDNKVIFECDEYFNKNYIKLLTDDKNINLEVDVLDNRLISSEQRKLIYCLLRDVADFTGYEIEQLKDIIKNYFIFVKNEEIISLSDCSKTQAKEFINVLIDIIMDLNIPLKKRYGYLLQDNYFFYKCLKFRKCCVCGKDNADIAHVETVGMGRDRRKINHEDFRFMCLCREHHTEQHSIGIDTFINKYKIILVKLSREELYKILGYGRREES